MKKLMTGNEACARGAYEAGALFASAYPGTPSSEILENITTYPEIISEWAPNEKVALEAAFGASMAGARAMASMKHVGLNVAADPLMTISYTGVNGGLVIITADEPGMHSSQNEQDNRLFAVMAKLPMFEPSGSEETRDMVKAAFDLSEEYDTAVLMRTTTRVCHSKGILELGERKEKGIKPYVKNAAKYVMTPANARTRRFDIEERIKRLAAFSETCPWNFVEDNASKTGVIASGICFEYAKEVFGKEASYLKLGFTNPMPAGLIRNFCEGKEKVYIIEENDPYIEIFLKSLGIDCIGQEVFPFCGEKTPDILRTALYGKNNAALSGDKAKLVPRPPILCAGCPHRGFFYELSKRKNVTVAGDIGCYTLASSPPFNSMDWCVCMGSSLSTGHGAQKIFNLAPETARRVIAVLGDSTFFHMGVHALMEVVYNDSNTVSVILDNRTTGMTGHQQNPGTGYGAAGKSAPLIDIEAVVRACGVKHVRTINPNNIAAVRETLDWALALDEPSVIITKYPCVLKPLSVEDKAKFPDAFAHKYKVNPALCIGCKLCLGGGCPALSFDENEKKAVIDGSNCTGCGVCAQICPKNAIAREG